MRILVLGSTGMLGHKMLERLRLRYEDVIGLSRADGLDAEDFGIRELDPFNPQVVINCVGVIKQRVQKTEQSIAVNSLFPHRLQRICGDLGARLIHFSTDCVFSGRRGDYSELDKPDPEDMYGRTKLLGEVTQGDVVTIRTSIIGREKSNFKGLLEWFLRQRGIVSGHDNSIFSGVTTNWLSDTIATVLNHESNIKGLWQIASQPISKFHLLRLIKEVYNRKDIQIINEGGPVCDRSLDGFAFENATGIETPDWSEMLIEQREQDKESGYVL